MQYKRVCYNEVLLYFCSINEIVCCDFYHAAHCMRLSICPVHFVSSYIYCEFLLKIRVHLPKVTTQSVFGWLFCPTASLLSETAESSKLTTLSIWLPFTQHTWLSLFSQISIPYTDCSCQLTTTIIYNFRFSNYTKYYTSGILAAARKYCWFVVTVFVAKCSIFYVNTYLIYTYS